jgi:hypothetical protein
MADEELKQKSKRLDAIRKKIVILKTNIMCGVLDLGILLLEVQRNKLWEVADYETFDAFLSGDVDVSRTTAYRTMEIVKMYIETLKYERKELEAMDETKLLAIIPVINKLTDEEKTDEIKDWFKKAQGMSKQDLIDDVTEFVGKPSKQPVEGKKPLDEELTGTFKLVKMDGGEGYRNFSIGSTTVKVFKVDKDFYAEF